MASRTPAENLRVPDFLKMFESSLVKRQVGIVEFAESEQFCNPPDSPIWMADLSFKPIGEISIGDRIMGWQSGIKSYKTMCSSEVLDVKVRYASIVKVTMESGKSFRCTPDHQWLTGSLGFGKRSKDAYIKQGNQWFGPPKIGRSLVHIIDSPSSLDVTLQQQAFWLGGIYDGEGSCSSKSALQIGQSKLVNPDVYEKIIEVLTNLGFTFTKTFDRINLTQNKTNRGQKSDFLTVQALTDFINWCKPVKAHGIFSKINDRRMWRNLDQIISIEPDGYGKVIGLTTSTGNYICNGYASKNCGKKLYPKQRTLLKLLFLEDLDNYDRRVINEWEQSSKTGGEITICPRIWDRYDYLRERKYPHFQRIVLVGGRRSGKGFITGLAVAKKIYDMTLLENVGAYYGVDEDKDIHIQIVANSKEQAKEMQFADATNCLLSCKELISQGLLSKVLAESTSIFTPYDKKRIMRIEESQGKIDKDLAKIRLQAQGTNSRTLRGQASLIYVFDEFAHFLSGESNMSSDEIYAAAIPSLMQFGKDSMVFLNSSPYTEIGKFFDIYNDSLRLDPPDVGMPVYPDLFMLQYPSWELYSGWREDPYWCDFLMTKDQGPPAVSPDIPDEQLTTADEKIKAQLLRFEEASNPETFKVEYRSIFAKVVDAFLNPEMVDRGFDPTYTKQRIGRYLEVEEGARGHVFMYKGHGDPSSVVANFGIAIAHVEHFDEEVEDHNGNKFILPVPHVLFDFVHAFYPEDFPDNTIDWMEVLPQITRLINAFRPVEWTFDQFNSTFAIQKLQSDLAMMGISETQVYEKPATASTNRRVAMNFKTALNLGRVHFPHPTYPKDSPNKRSLDLLRQELKFLQEKNGKIDKQDIGPCRTSDIADCAFECVDFLIGDSLVMGAFMDIKPEFGGLTGYGIGGKHDNPFQAFYDQNVSKATRNLARGGRLNGNRRNIYGR